MSVPTWVQHHLETCGRWNDDHVSRKVAVTRCRTCRRQVYSGLDGDRCALPVLADTHPLSALGETAAHTIGLSTFALRWNLEHLRLDRRDHWSIAGRPAGTPTRAGGLPSFDVVAAHSCSVLSLPGAPSIYADSRRARYDGSPPF